MLELEADPVEAGVSPADSSPSQPARLPLQITDTTNIFCHRVAENALPLRSSLALDNYRIPESHCHWTFVILPATTSTSKGPKRPMLDFLPFSETL